jgi:hypothetical protein
MCVRGIDFASVFTIFDSDLEVLWRCGIFLYSSLVRVGYQNRNSFCSDGLQSFCPVAKLVPE